MKLFLITFSLFIFTLSKEPNQLDALDIDISKFKVASSTNQIILVIPANYTTTSATLYFYIKEGEKWNQQLETRANIGKNGLGKEKEGDNKTPVGVYKFNRYFGIYDNPGTDLDYVKVNESHYWDGDSNSSNYNTLVNIETYKDFDPSESEHLTDYNPGYEYAMNINYNEEKTKHKGSAIFLHCFTRNNYTGGCVAIEREKLKEIYTKINKDCNIIIDTKENMTRYQNYQNSKFINIGFLMIICLILTL